MLLIKILFCNTQYFNGATKSVGEWAKSGRKGTISGHSGLGKVALRSTNSLLRPPLSISALLIAFRL